VAQVLVLAARDNHIQMLMPREEKLLEIGGGWWYLWAYEEEIWSVRLVMKSH